MTQAAFNKFINKPGSRSKFIFEICQYFDITPGECLTGIETSERIKPLPSPETVEKLEKSSRKSIPVVGTTQGGPDRHWEDLGYPTDWGDEYAPIESDDPHAYLLRVEGDRMSPRINEGDYVLVEPSTLSQPGDIVVARLTSGEVMLKYFRADHGDEIILESQNPGLTLKTVQKADIDFIHQVSGTLYRRKIIKSRITSKPVRSPARKSVRNEGGESMAAEEG